MQYLVERRMHVKWTSCSMHVMIIVTDAGMGVWVFPLQIEPHTRIWRFKTSSDSVLTWLNMDTCVCDPPVPSTLSLTNVSMDVKWQVLIMMKCVLISTMVVLRASYLFFEYWTQFIQCVNMNSYRTIIRPRHIYYPSGMLSSTSTHKHIPVYTNGLFPLYLSFGIHIDIGIFNR